MSNTTKHKESAKFHNGLIEQIPIKLRLFWNRHNYEKGYFLSLRTKKREAIIERETNNELNEI